MDRLLAPWFTDVEPLIGRQAARYSAISALTFAAAWAGAVVLLVAIFLNTRYADRPGGALSLVGLVLLAGFGVATLIAGYRAAEAAKDHLEAELGFRPRWPIGGYWGKRGWPNAIARQRRWHTSGRWPLLPL